nr:uncharacterized protein LOC127303505 [Lolium perenne]
MLEHDVDALLNGFFLLGPSADFSGTLKRDLVEDFLNETIADPEEHSSSTSKVQYDSDTGIVPTKFDNNWVMHVKVLAFFSIGVFVRSLSGERSPDADGDTRGCIFFMRKNCDLKRSWLICPTTSGEHEQTCLKIHPLGFVQVCHANFEATDFFTIGILGGCGTCPSTVGNLLSQRWLGLWAIASSMAAEHLRPRRWLGHFLRRRRLGSCVLGGGWGSCVLDGQRTARRLGRVQWSGRCGGPSGGMDDGSRLHRRRGWALAWMQRKGEGRRGYGAVSNLANRYLIISGRGIGEGMRSTR